MSKHKHIGYGKLIFLIIVCAILTAFALPAHSADVLIIGNSKLKPVADVIAGIKKAVSPRVTVASPQDAKYGLERMVRKEKAKVVIALGKDSILYANSLPESIPVVYGLVIDPLETNRKNITGIYMTTPLNKYISFINTHFPGIKKIGVICSHTPRESLYLSTEDLEIKFCAAKTPYEFIEKLSSFGSDLDALLLLPEKDLITSKVLEEVYLFSFKEKVPVIGISEKYVKIGSLFSLGFDISEMGRQLGALTNKVLARGSASGIPNSAPDKLALFINNKTSKTMSVDIPENLLNSAKKVY